MVIIHQNKSVTNEITKMRQVAQNIKKYRQAKKLSQNAFAEKLDISREHLAKVETAKSFASLQLIFKIAEELNIEVKSLFEF